MNIIISNTIQKQEHNLKRGEFVSYLITSIMNICKEDPYFKDRENYSEIDKDINILSRKLNKNKTLLEKSIKMSADLSDKLKNIEEEIYINRAKALEEMGSEL